MKKKHQSATLTAKQFLKKIRIVMDFNHKIEFDHLKKLGKLG